MNRNSNQKVWAGILVAAMMIASSIVVTATVKADPPINKHMPPPIGVPVPPPQMPSCTVLWAQTWSNGNPSVAESGRITTDSWKNVYTTGCDNFGQATVLKYNESGVLQWENHPTTYDDPEDLAITGGYDMGKGHDNSTQYQYVQSRFLTQLNTYMLWDIAFSPKDNTVVSCGWAMIDGLNVAFVAKNDVNTGTQIWGRQYTFLQPENGLPIIAAITVASNGDIFVSGTAIQFNGDYLIAVSGFYIKIGEYGATRSAKVDQSPSGWLTVYTGIDLKTNGNVVMTGYEMNGNSLYKVVAVERNPSSGTIINSNLFNIDMFAVHMIIDKVDNNIYICGGNGGSGSSTKGMILKLIPSLTIGYQYTNPINDFYQDISVKDAGNLMTASERQDDQYTISLHYKDTGILRAKWEIGQAHHAGGQHVTSTAGIATDLNGDVVACGGFGCIDTIKCAVTTQQDIIWQT
jgi:hypothetical protein